MFDVDWSRTPEILAFALVVASRDHVRDLREPIGCSQFMGLPPSASSSTLPSVSGAGIHEATKRVPGRIVCVAHIAKMPHTVYPVLVDEASERLNEVCDADHSCLARPFLVSADSVLTPSTCRQAEVQLNWLSLQSPCRQRC